MSVRGIFASHSAIVGDRQQSDFAGRILMNGYGGMAPMLALSSGMPKDNIKNTSFSWVEDSHISGNAKSTAAYAANITTIVVDDSNIWVPNSIILHESSGEQMLVTAISGNSCTVVRGFANTTASAIALNDRLQLISTAFAEGTDGADAVSQVGESRTNYVQIFKSAWGVTGTTKAVEYQSGSKVAENKQQAMTYLSEQIERAFMFGRPYVTQLNNKQLRTSGGIQYAIQTYGGINVAAADNSVAGRLNMNTLNNFIRRIFDRNVKGFPNERLCYAGSAVLELINQMVMDMGEYKISVSETDFGLEVVTIKTFNGTLKILTHPLFVENDTWNRELWCLHPAGIRRKELRALQSVTQTQQNQQNAKDADNGHLLCEMGFEVKGVKTMGMITNIQTAGGIGSLPIS